MFLPILYFFIVVVLFQVCYYLFVFGKFSFAKDEALISNKNAVSVIVCAKNEAENVKKHLPLLLKQNYPNFEIVLIDDASNDSTLEIFEAFEKENSTIKLVKVKNNEAFWGNKKYALTLGIKAAKYDTLLFTDADCYPSSENWISQMMAGFANNKKIVLGYGGYEKITNSFLNKLIRFETVATAISYFSWAKLKNPYMGVGRNLAYKKEEFFRVNGFINHIQVRSGDDDLFVNEAATGDNTEIIFCPESFTYSAPKKTFNAWFTQKRRHVATSKYYKKIDKSILGIFYISQFLFLIGAISLLALQFAPILVGCLVFIRYCVAWIIFGVSAKKLKEKDIIPLFPIIEFILIFIQFSVFSTNLVSKPHHWK